MSGERILTLYGGIGLFETDGETGVNTNLSAFQLRRYDIGGQRGLQNCSRTPHKSFKFG